VARVIFARRDGESIIIGDDIIITVLETRCDEVRLAVDAPIAERDRLLDIIDRAADRLREIDLEDLEEARILLGVRSKGHGLAVSHAITSVELARRILAEADPADPEGEGVDDDFDPARYRVATDPMEEAGFGDVADGPGADPVATCNVAGRQRPALDFLHSRGHRPASPPEGGGWRGWRKPPAATGR
jgi:carbon storage regulator